ncbi:MAG: DJ-1/PfpI family protein [Clostridia bacterium]|nr:DJ-1/PfpI family protein [Clostridia bacterium]
MVHVYLADGFEPIEGLCPVDLMRRAGIEVVTVSINETTAVKAAHGMTVIADTTAAELGNDIPELVMLPGGMPGTLNLGACKAVTDAVMAAWEAGSFVAAICAAPSVLGALGLTAGREAVCYPGFEDKLTGARLSEAHVVRDGKLITAIAMGASVEFGLALIEALRGKSCADKIKESVFA